MSKPIFDDLFSFSVRRNRLSYFLQILVISLILFPAIGVLVAAASLFGPTDPHTARANAQEGILGLIMLVLLIPYIIIRIASSVQRCHDCEWTGWLILLLLVPGVGFIFALLLLFVRGTSGPNRFGADPLQDLSAVF